MDILLSLIVFIIVFIIESKADSFIYLKSGCLPIMIKNKFIVIKKVE